MTRLLAFALGAAVVLAGCREDALPPSGGGPDPPRVVVAPDTSDAAPLDDRTDDPDPAEIVFPPTAPEPERPRPAPPAPRPDPPPSEPAPTVSTRSAVGSCDARARESVCFAFSGTAWTPEAAQAECAQAAAGIYNSAPCPTAARIGECVFRPDGDATREIVHTFYAPMDPLLAEAVCRGTFRAF